MKIKLSLLLAFILTVVNIFNVGCAVGGSSNGATTTGSTNAGGAAFAGNSANGIAVGSRAAGDIAAGIAAGSSAAGDIAAGGPTRTIYVSPDGNDAKATGEIGAPYKSINTALEAAGQDVAITLRGGVYREGENVRVRNPNVTIMSAKDEWAIIDLTTSDSGKDEDSGVYFDVDSSGGRLLNVEVAGGYYAVCMETKWGWHGDDDWVAASDIIIEGCILHDSKYDVIKVKPNCDNIIIRNNEIYNSGRAETDKPYWLDGEANAEGIDNVNGAKMVVQNNYIHDIGGNGVYAKGGATDALIENNIVEHIYGAGIMVGFDTSPEWFDTSVNPQYYENVRGVVRNNLIIDTGWEGLGFYGSKDAQVYNNTLVNVDNGRLEVHSAVYFGLTYQDWDTGAGRPASVNPDFHDNIVSQPASFNRQMIEIRYSDDLGGMSALSGNPVMNKNCYYIAGKSAAFTDNRPRSLLENAGLPAWQSHISGDSGSFEADPALDADYIPANPQCAGMGANLNINMNPIKLEASAISSLVGLSQSGASGVFDTSGAFTASGAQSIANFAAINIYANGLFADVNEDEWYGNNQSKSVANAYNYGLMRGNSDTTFNPGGNITIAEAVTVAARVYSIYADDGYDFAPGGGGGGGGDPWYMIYVDYAINNGLIDDGDFADYSRAATRAEMAYIFARSLPDTEFISQNTVNSLPDVNNETPHLSAILRLYEAGVITGIDEQGTFNPGVAITRAEAAAIITRVILPAARASGKTY